MPKNGEQTLQRRQRLGPEKLVLTKNRILFVRDLCDAMGSLFDGTCDVATRDSGDK